MYTDFVPVLCDLLPRQGVCVVSPLLSSSYLQFGMCSLESDAAELDQLLEHLAVRIVAVTALADVQQTRFPHLTAVLVMGHSTGAQLCVTHARIGARRHLVSGYILHSPVSDSDWLRHTVPAAELAQWAVLPPDHIGVFPGLPMRIPVTAARMQSLLGDEGAMFSLQDRSALPRLLAHMAAHHVLVVLAGAEEYAPPPYDAGLHLKVLLESMAGRALEPSGGLLVDANACTVSSIAATAQGCRKDGVVLANASHASAGLERELAELLVQWVCSVAAL